MPVDSAKPEGLKAKTRAVIPLALPMAAGELVARAAEIVGKPMSTFIRESAVAKARRIITSHARRQRSAA